MLRHSTLLPLFLALPLSLAGNPPAAEEDACEVYVDNDLRLAGVSPDAGRVEIRRGGKWGTICGELSMPAARVLCHELGYGRAIGVFSVPPKVKTPNFLSGVECTGDETTVLDCKIGSTGCSEDSPTIAVRCESEGLENVEHIELSELKLAGVDPRTVLVDYKPPQNANACGSFPKVNPFGDNEVNAFVHKDKMGPWLKERTTRLEEVMCRASENPSKIDSLTDAGLIMNRFGVDFTPVANAGPRGDALVKGDRADVVRDAFLSPNAKLFWSLDHEHRYPSPEPQLSGSAADIFKNLSRDGFVRIDDFGLDMDELDKTAKWALNQREQKNVTVVLADGESVVARPDIPALEPLIKNETVNSFIRAYLGDDTVLHGYKILRVSARMKGADNYIAADWHHDRAGRRLKMFVFLHDVDNHGGRPTEVANKTSNLVYHAFEEYATSRYDDSYIQQNYDIHQMGGKRGGGFIFDTNAIHRGSPWGNVKRETIILEYHNAYKCPAIHSLGLNVPCPSGDQHMVNQKI